MFGAGLRAGERFMPGAWLGFVLAVGGLVWLVLPGVTAPAPMGAGLMVLAGMAWGVYSLRGRGAVDPLGATARNFLRAAPMALAVNAALLARAHATSFGIVLAIASGALTSGIGYVFWYAALNGLSAMRAATVQLSVPPIASFAGVLLLSEAITPRLVIASAATLSGVALVLASRTRRGRPARAASTSDR